jgi:hypothetical protein
MTVDSKYASYETQKPEDRSVEEQKNGIDLIHESVGESHKPNTLAKE